MSAKINCQVKDIFENPGKDVPYTVLKEDEKLQDGKVDSDGNIKLDDLVPGDIYIFLSDKISDDLEVKTGSIENNTNIIKISDSDLERVKIKLSLYNDNLIIIKPDTAPASF